jgi:hypothetical protein
MAHSSVPCNLFFFGGGGVKPLHSRAQNSVACHWDALLTRRLCMVSRDNCVPNTKSIKVPCTRQGNSCYRLCKTALTAVDWLVFGLTLLSDWFGYVKPSRTWAPFLRVCSMWYRIRLSADLVHESHATPVVESDISYVSIGEEEIQNQLVVWEDSWTYSVFVRVVQVSKTQSLWCASFLVGPVGARKGIEGSAYKFQCATYELYVIRVQVHVSGTACVRVQLWFPYLSPFSP